MTLPETRYVSVGGAQVAYQVAGTGVEDFVYCFALGSQLDLVWQTLIGIELLGRLTRERRVILYDRRGSGASDAVPLNAIPTWEVQAEDLTAVLDAVGSERTAVMANIESGPIAILFAAMHPKRVSHLILNNSTARYLATDDYPIGMSPEQADALLAVVAAEWGTEDFVRMIMPSYADDAELMASYARTLRASATPRSAAAQYEYFIRNVDVRGFLALVQAPTLILHPTDSPFMPIQHGRYLAEHIPNAKIIERSGADLIPKDSDKTRSDVIEFLTGERPVDANRVLATVLFTDIVGSTERVSAMGDRAWRNLLRTHDALARTLVDQQNGRVVKTTGDGILATFDGPGRAIRCAESMRDALRTVGLEIRAGIHTGEVEVMGDDIAGLGVHIASRILDASQPGTLFVSPAVPMLVAGAGFEFEDRGEYELKGVPGMWKLFVVKG